MSSSDLAAAVEAFVGVRPDLQQCGPPGAASGTDKALGPAPLEQECRAARFVWKGRLGTQLAIAPVPPKAPAAVVYNGARRHHTTWDNG